LNLAIITFNAVDDTSNRNSKFSNTLEYSNNNTDHYHRWVS
jgi:hypothetical protein